MRRALSLVVSSAILAISITARGQAADPPAGPASTSPAEFHRIRGWVAWRRAVWEVRREGFESAASELELARGASGKLDFTSLFFLGFSYLRLLRTDLADPALADARKLAPDFIGFDLTDALRLTAEPSKTDEESRERLAAAVDRYDRYLERIATYGKSEPFATELLFLGHFFRGHTYSRIPGKLDHAVTDLTRAMQIAEEAHQPPAAEAVSLIAAAHKDLEQFDEAEKVIRAAMMRSPAEPAHYYNLGLVLAAQHKEQDAVPWFEAAIARRPDFAEAHLKLAYVAWQSSGDLTSMRSHLEAASFIYDARTKSGSPPDAGSRADIESGLGAYWQTAAEKRRDALDAAGSLDAYLEARRHLLAALAENPACLAALNRLIQIANATDASQAEKDDLKRRLREIEKNRGSARGSTFC